MWLDISSAPQSGEEIPFSLTAAFDPIEWHSQQMTFPQKVQVDGTYRVLKGRVSLSGEVRTVMELPCANCLVPARVEMTAPLSAVFDRDEDPEDPDVFPYEGGKLPLYDAVLGALLLNFPMRVLCRPDCRGLCPSCYRNLNQETCACQKEPNRENPFSALASLLIKDEEV